MLKRRSVRSIGEARLDRPSQGSSGWWLGTWHSERFGILALVLGGMFIFPSTQLILRLMGRHANLKPDNPLKNLAMQIAFIVPLTLPVAGGATLYKMNWFFPACAIIVGAHYLPFAFLYGMRIYLLLAAALMVEGMVIGLYFQESFATAGWWTAGILFAFAAATLVARGKETAPELS